MLVLVKLSSLMMMMMMMKRSDVASAKTINARSGDIVLLSSDLLDTDLEAGQDFRWTHSNLVVSSKRSDTCEDKNCELLEDGSLRFSRVQPSDAGEYSLQVFSKTGTKVQNMTVLLIVEAGGSSSSSSGGGGGGSSVVMSVLICCLLLVLLSTIVFIHMRRMRRSQATKTTTDHLEENVYVTMHGNKTKDPEKKEKEKEETLYVDCNDVISMKTPVTQQMSVAIEDIYV